ncbi:hypothetical protein CMUS01_08427 [Colletotrichum musicola]|uniref:Uncharacterized protein n=1 Tax=Colletotrichum musicola TaxID=2175873 RepID=A0A8H6KCC4_9PEZI|nr:hypothetical protein CMUS01_08427 [Colletotrichum musicola]
MSFSPSQLPPFTHQVLAYDTTTGDASSRRIEADFADLLPASSRTPKDDLTIPDPSSVLAWVDVELDLRRLADVHEWLWIAGRPMPPRPLHQ